MALKDYYAVLGLDNEADSSAIKKAYRQLATKWHPDKHQNASEEEQKEAEEKFKEISEAYSVLSDPEQKANYDATGDPRGSGFNFRATGDPFNLFRSFHNFGPRAGSPGPMAGRDFNFLLSLSLVEALFGVEKSLDFTVPVLCTACDAKGGTELSICSTCQGQGMVTHRQANMIFQTTCPACLGQGEQIKTICTTCKGQKVRQEEKHVKVKVPAGIKPGARLRLAGAGGPGLNGGPPGDLNIQVQIDLPDLSHLSEEERKQLESLLLTCES